MPSRSPAASLTEAGDTAPSGAWGRVWRARREGGRGDSICIGARARSRQDTPRLMVPEAMGGKAEWLVGLGGEIY